MVNDILKNNKFLGMIQSKQTDGKVYQSWMSRKNRRT